MTNDNFFAIIHMATLSISCQYNATCPLNTIPSNYFPLAKEDQREFCKRKSDKIAYYNKEI